jgi:hypothetical protein
MSEPRHEARPIYHHKKGRSKPTLAIPFAALAALALHRDHNQLVDC